MIRIGGVITLLAVASLIAIAESQALAAGAVPKSATWRLTHPYRCWPLLWGCRWRRPNRCKRLQTRKGNIQVPDGYRTSYPVSRYVGDRCRRR